MERRSAPQHVFDTVNRLGGWIDDTRYSNLMNTIRLTLPAFAFKAFVDALDEAGIVVESLQDLGGDPKAERMATLKLSFIHDEPDLHRDVPAIPG